MGKSRGKQRGWCMGDGVWEEGGGGVESRNFANNYKMPRTI